MSDTMREVPPFHDVARRMSCPSCRATPHLSAPCRDCSAILTREVNAYAACVYRRGIADAVRVVEGQSGVTLTGEKHMVLGVTIAGFTTTLNDTVSRIHTLAALRTLAQEPPDEH